MAPDTSVTVLPDEALIEQSRRAGGRPAADALYDELFRRYSARVTEWCARIVRDPDRAPDLAQEVFLRAFQRLDTFRGESRLSTWLYTIARNHCFNALKKRAGQGIHEELPADLPGSDGSDVHKAAEHKQDFHRLWQVMQGTLTPLELHVVTLHYGHEVPLADLTRSLLLQNPSGAKAYIVNARRKLNAVLRPKGRNGRHDATTPPCAARRPAC